MAIMGKNLGTKIGIIVAVLLFFTYGIIGIPHGSLKQSVADRIHLGLDLKGGTHLVLAVHVAEAIGSTTDRTVQQLESDMPGANLVGATAAKLDPTHPEVITISGVQVSQSTALRTLIGGLNYTTYALTSASDGTYKLTMTPTAITDLESRTLDTSIDTIRERIDKLGVTEPVIQKYGLGENQILVELPGISDVGHVE